MNKFDVRLPFIIYMAFISSISCTSKSAENFKRREHQNDNHITSNIKLPKTEEINFFYVTKIVDGDTFWIDNLQPDGLKIRFIGIDAPENRNAFNRKKQFYGEESKRYLVELLKDQKVRLEFDIDSLDPFQRTLAYVYLEDGEMVNELIVKSGHGILMTVVPNIKYESRFFDAQKYAQENKLGLWGAKITEAQ